MQHSIGCTSQREHIEIKNQNGDDSVEILNDDYLLEIFNRLDIFDLCHVADVCKRFKKIAMLSFSLRFKKFSYPESFLIQNYSRDKKSQMRRVLCKFGHLIQSVYIRDYPPYKHNIFRDFMEEDYNPPAELDVIAKYCGGALKELDLELYRPLKCGVVMPLFKSLEILSVVCPRFQGDANELFKECVQLKVLKIRCIPFTYTRAPEFLQRYPNLEEIDFLVDSVETISSLLQMNPQIRKLELLGLHVDKIVCAVAPKLEKLEHLILRELSGPKDMKELRKLKSLTVLEIGNEYGYETRMVPIMEAMENFPLECLKINAPIWDHCSSDFLQLKFLKKLHLKNIFRPFDDFFTNLGEQLPLLEELELCFIHFAETHLFSIDGLKGLIKSSKKLSLIVIRRINPFEEYSLTGEGPLIIKNQSSILTISIHNRKPNTMVMVNDLLHLESVDQRFKYICCTPIAISVPFDWQGGYSYRSFFRKGPLCQCSVRVHKNVNINTGTLLQNIIKIGKNIFSVTHLSSGKLKNIKNL